jgi:hypothetical protein
MTNLADLFIYGADELIERHWAEVSTQMEMVVVGDEAVDRASMSMAEHCFKAGWVSCLKAIMDAEQRKDGQT